ncbi:MAG: Gfo/Idh/MocA family oxidoreductase, partial [Chloroflexi bacterium]|nr:Gfo/Idh/MocA family oxidoreductase [Chloroflexota bacterium]
RSADLLADPNVEAVIVATNDAAHGANGLEVLRARKHLFLEKPMAQTIAECDAMIEAWRGSGVVFMVGLELRYCSLVQEMRAILDRGDIGAVKLAYAMDNVSVGGQYYYHDRRRLKEYIVSLVLEKGTHTLDLMNWFIGGQPTRVYAEGGLDVFGGDAPNDKRCRDCEIRATCPYFVASEGFVMDYGQVLKAKPDLCVYARECDVDDNTTVTVRYDNGCKMNYMECHFTPDYSREFTLIGDKGRMYGFYNNEQDFRIEVTFRHSDKKDLYYPPKRPGGHGGGDPMIQDAFLRRVQAGTPSCPGVVGARNAAAIAIASAQAVAAGRVVDIPPCPPAPDEI